VWSDDDDAADGVLGCERINNRTSARVLLGRLMSSPKQQTHCVNIVRSHR
jgi:hypothetical protein